MLSLIISKFNEGLVDFFNEYGIDYDIQYNSDLDMISQYSKSLNVRSLFSQSDLNLIQQSDLDKLCKNTYNLMMFNYSPLNLTDWRNRNTNLSLVLNPNSKEGLEALGGMVQTSDWSDDLIQTFKSIRTLNAEHKDGIVRDAIIGKFDLTYKFLTTSTELINRFQFLYLRHYRNLSAVALDFDFGEKHEKESITYNVEASDLESVGHVDYNAFGSLQELTFTIKLEGLILSFYNYAEKYLAEVDLDLQVKSFG